ncbi:MAG: hypothetical protein AAGH15_25220 [Myxococcota bacterium]
MRATPLALPMLFVAASALAQDGRDAEGYEARLATASVRLQARDFAGAEVVLRDAVTLDATRPEAHCALGDALRGSGDVPGASAAYAECRTKARGLAQLQLEGRALLGEVRLRLRSGPREAAQAALDALVRFAEAHPEVFDPAAAGRLAELHAARVARLAAHAELRARRAEAAGDR